LDVVFSTIWKGLPGCTSVILKKVDPKSKPITLALAVVDMHAISKATMARPIVPLFFVFSCMICF